MGKSFSHSLLACPHMLHVRAWANITSRQDEINLLQYAGEPYVGLRTECTKCHATHCYMKLRHAHALALPILHG